MQDGTREQRLRCKLSSDGGPKRAMQRRLQFWSHVNRLDLEATTPQHAQKKRSEAGGDLRRPSARRQRHGDAT